MTFSNEIILRIFTQSNGLYIVPPSQINGVNKTTCSVVSVIIYVIN